MNNRDFISLKMMYEQAFNSPDGKKVLADIMLSGFDGRTTFSVEPLEMARDEGKREIALHIKDMSTPQKEIKKSEAIT